MRIMLSTTLITSLLFAMPQAVLADDVTDAIAEAQQAYEEGDLAYAKESLDFASQLISQQKAGALVSYLPEPLDGWTAQEAQSESIGAAMFGGGTTASRLYQKDGASVNITYTADSPMIAQMAAMITNPALVGANGGKLMRFGRQKAMIDDSGTVQFMVDNRVMVQVEGDASEEDKVAYAKAIDLKKLKDY